MSIAIPAFLAILLASCIGKLLIAYAEKRRTSKTNNKQKDKEKK